MAFNVVVAIAVPDKQQLAKPLQELRCFHKSALILSRVLTLYNALTRQQKLNNLQHCKRFRCGCF